MTTINDISDLARTLREHPEWRETIRALVLGEEVSQLPAQLASFIEATERNFEAVDKRLEAMDQRIAALDKRLDEFIAATQRRLDDFIAATERNFEAVDKRLEAMDQRIAALDKRLDEFIAATQRRLDDFIAATQRNFQIAYNRLDSLQERHDLLGAGLSRLTGRVDNGLGAYYEFRAEKLVRSLAGRDLDLSRVRVLLGARTGFGNQFADLLEDAWRAGLVTRDQYQELLQLDLVFAAQRNSDGAAVHVAAEVSITAGDSDIVRAARRAAALAAVTGGEVLPAVISAHIDHSRTILAAEQNVAVMLLPES
jgi:predicted translin family RNA/ssDNA-binding protein